MRAMIERREGREERGGGKGEGYCHGGQSMVVADFLIRHLHLPSRGCEFVWAFLSASHPNL